MSNLYRPSNGSEGMDFIARYCEHCTKDSETEPCGILGRTFYLNVDDPDYPTEWIKVERPDGCYTGRCTAFIEREKLTL